jgi:hypothetical protein
VADEKIRRAARAGDEDREGVEQARAGRLLLTGIPPEDLAAIDAEAERRGVARLVVLREAVHARAAGGPQVEWPAYCRMAELLDVELEDLDLPRAEACLLADALNGCGMTLAASPEAATVGALRLEVSDAIALTQVHDKWGVPAAAIIERLRPLTDMQARAIYAGAARFWQLTDLPTDVALRASGLWRGSVEAPAPPKRAPQRHPPKGRRRG